MLARERSSNDAALHGGTYVSRWSGHPHGRKGGQCLPRRGRKKHRRGCDLGSFLCHRRQEKNLLYLRCPKSGSDPEDGEGERTPRRQHHRGAGSRSLLLSLIVWVLGSGFWVLGFGFWVW